MFLAAWFQPPVSVLVVVDTNCIIGGSLLADVRISS